MTYNVFGGTLNPPLLYFHSHVIEKLYTYNFNCYILRTMVPCITVRTSSRDDIIINADLHKSELGLQWYMKQRITAIECLFLANLSVHHRVL